MSRLSDEDLNHAFELNLFTLTDPCSAPCHYSKFDFYGSMEELLTENQDDYDEDRRLYAGRFALLKGKTSFVMKNFPSILEIIFPETSSSSEKLEKCLQDALFSGRIELVQFILNKLGRKEE